jgi:hypothetical protein
MNTPAGQVVGLAEHRRTADRRQADYYRRLLEDQRAQVHEELAEHSQMLARHQRAGDLSGVKRMRRLVRAKETELITLDRLIQALDRRFGAYRRPPH